MHLEKEATLNKRAVFVEIGMLVLGVYRERGLGGGMV